MSNAHISNATSATKRRDVSDRWRLVQYRSHPGITTAARRARGCHHDCQGAAVGPVYPVPNLHPATAASNFFSFAEILTSIAIASTVSRKDYIVGVREFSPKASPAIRPTDQQTHCPRMATASGRPATGNAAARDAENIDSNSGTRYTPSVTSRRWVLGARSSRSSSHGSTMAR